MSGSNVKNEVVSLKNQPLDIQKYVKERLGDAVDKAIVAEVVYIFKVRLNIADIAQERSRQKTENEPTSPPGERWKPKKIDISQIAPRPLTNDFSTASWDMAARKQKYVVPEFATHQIDAQNINEGGFYAYKNGILRCLEKKTAEPLGRYQHVSLFEKVYSENEIKTTRIPHSKFVEKGVRQVLEAEFFRQLIRALAKGYACDHPVPRDGDTRSRYYTTILQSGDLIEMAGDLRLAWVYAFAGSISSETFATKTCRLIATEYAVTASIELKHALSEVENASGKPDSLALKLRREKDVRTP